MAHRFRQSGDYEGKSFGGSTIVRSHLYIWAVSVVAPGRQKIPDDIGLKLSSRYQELRKTVKEENALIRILFLTTRLLYRELIKQFCHLDRTYTLVALIFLISARLSRLNL